MLVQLPECEKNHYEYERVLAGLIKVNYGRSSRYKRPADAKPIAAASVT